MTGFDRAHSTPSVAHCPRPRYRGLCVPCTSLLPAPGPEQRHRYRDGGEPGTVTDCLCPTRPSLLPAPPSFSTSTSHPSSAPPSNAPLNAPPLHSRDASPAGPGARAHHGLRTRSEPGHSPPPSTPRSTPLPFILNIYVAQIHLPGRVPAEGRLGP
jgi:hypothetical protein